MALPSSFLSLPTESTAIQLAAVMYVALGLPPVPVYGVSATGVCHCGQSCDKPGKHPVGSAWQRAATLDTDAVRDRFRDHQGNIGLYLGSTPHVVLDADGDIGLATLETWGVPETLRAQSGSLAGAHLLYNLAAHHDKGAITDRRVAPGLDIKTRGQFVVAPSRHASGNVYHWTHPLAIATMPDWLFERIRKPERVSSVQPVAEVVGGDLYERARRYLAKIPPAISGSGGHNQAFAAARALGGFVARGLPRSDAWALLCGYNVTCQPPWDERELEHKFNDGINAHTPLVIADRPKRGRPSLRALAGGLSNVDTSFGGPRKPTDDDSTPPNEPPSDGGAPPPSNEPDWRGLLLWARSKSGDDKLVSHCENVMRILQLHDDWKGRIRFNAFSQEIECSGDLPWNEYHRPTESLTYWTDQDATRLHGWLRNAFHRHGFNPALTDCERAVDVVARAHAFHPVREYLDGLAWDGTARLATWPTRYLGAEASEYHGTVGRWWLISAVARIFEPGCKVDTVPILESDQQGRRKSTAIAVLAGQWFSDAEIDIAHKDAAMLIQGSWLVELGEVDSLMRSEPSEAKRFFSRPTDKFRPPWGRRPIIVPRQCIFVGSTNLREYLWDPTGARRYMPIACGVIDIEALRADRDQLWAEAVVEYREGRKWYPETEADRELMVDQQAARTSDDSWEERVANYLRRQNAERVTSAEVLEHALSIPSKDWSRATQMRVGAVLSRIGWARRKYREGTRMLWGYFRP